MIYSVKLSNFKQHKSYEANFETGLNTVTGENGAGKTTVLKAIMFSLFGVAAAGAKNHLTTWGETKMQVETDLLLEVGRVTVIRGLTKAEVRLGDELLASGQTAVTGYIERQLGMNAKLFKNMLYAEQGETQALLKMGAAGLQKQLEVVANIEVIDKVITQITLDNNRSEGELSGIGEVGDINVLRDELETVTATVNKLTTQHLFTGVEVKDKERVLESCKSEHEKAVTATLSHSKLQSELTATTARLNLLTEQQLQLEAGKPCQIDEQEFKDKKAALTDLATKFEGDRNKLNDYNGKVAYYKSAVDHHHNLSMFTPAIIGAKALDVIKTMAKSTMDNTSAKVIEARKAVHSLDCLSCKRPLEGKDVARVNSEYEEAMGNLSVFTSEYGDASASLDAYLLACGYSLEYLLEVYTDLSRAEIDLKKAVNPDPVDITEESLQERRQELLTRSADLTNLQLDRKEYDLWLNQTNNLGLAIQSVEKSIEPLQERLALLTTYSTQDLEVLKVAQTLAQSDLQEQNNALRELAQSLNGATNHKTLLLTQVKLAEERLDKVNSIQHQLALRSELQKYLRTNRAKFMEDSWAALTNYAGHLINSTTEGLMHTLNRSDSGDFYILENGQTVPVEELSGARKSIVGLCLRLSLAHLFYGTGGFVLLDEVTADCSENNAARIAGMLRGLQSQVIMVTHHQGDAVNANHSILLEAA